jgi:hypothetical protein
MSDVGGGPPGLVSPIDLVFSDAAAGNVPEFTTPLAGTYLPTEEPVSDDNLPPPAPVEPPVGGPGSGYGSTVAAAAAGGVNGVWSLFVFDDSSGNGGSIAGWDVVLTVPDPAPPAPVPCKGKTPTIVGTDADETLKGTGKADVISGLGGSDVISGLGKDDRLCGGDGNDVLKGGGGKDLMSGGAGEDTCKGSGGKDKAASCETKRSIP